MAEIENRGKLVEQIPLQDQHKGHAPAQNGAAFTVEEVGRLLEVLHRLAERDVALPIGRVASLMRRSSRTIHRWASQGKLERLPDGSISARSILYRFVDGYGPTDMFNILSDKSHATAAKPRTQS